MKTHLSDRMASTIRADAGTADRVGDRNSGSGAAAERSALGLLGRLWSRRDRMLRAAARSADDGPALSHETVEALERIVERQGPLLGLPDDVESDYLRETHATSLLTRTLLAAIPALLFCVLALLAERVLNLTADGAGLMRDIAITVVLPASVAAVAPGAAAAAGRRRTCCTPPRAASAPPRAPAA